MNPKRSVPASDQSAGHQPPPNWLWAASMGAAQEGGEPRREPPPPKGKAKAGTADTKGYGFQTTQSPPHWHTGGADLSRTG